MTIQHIIQEKPQVLGYLYLTIFYIIYLYIYICLSFNTILSCHKKLLMYAISLEQKYANTYHVYNVNFNNKSILISENCDTPNLYTRILSISVK